MPDPIETAYRRALAAGRERGFQLTRQAVDRTYRALAEVLNRLTAEEAGGMITAERAERLRQETEALLRGLQADIVRSGEGAIGRTLTDIVEVHRRVTGELFRRYGPPGLETVAALSNFDRLPARALATMVSRPNAGTFRTLVNRRIGGMASEIDTLLDAAVARGAPAGRVTRDLARLMARDDPRLLRLLDRPEIFEGRLHRGVGTIEWASTLADDDVKALTGVLYDARRIVVTENNTAAMEATAQAMTESPIVTGATWELSGRHFHEDACDVLANSDLYGMGPGVYPPDRWPARPHPHCACMQGRAVFRPPSEWAQPKPQSPGLATDPRRPDLTDRWAEEWTENERERQQVAFAQAVAFGEQARRAA